MDLQNHSRLNGLLIPPGCAAFCIYVALHKKCHDVGLPAVAAVYEDIHEPRLKVNNESSQRI